MKKPLKAADGHSAERAGLTAAALCCVAMSAFSPGPGFGAAAKGSAGPCQPANAISAVVASVNERLELTLSDGRVLRIASIEPPSGSPTDPELGAPAHDWLAAWLENKAIRFAALEARPDRWGRWSAIVFAAQDSTGAQGLASAGENLIERGFARVVPDQIKNPCENRLLQIEKTARAARLGLWADPYYAAVSATDAPAFAEHAGSFILAEGKVTDLRGEGTSRISLFFGPHRHDSLAVTVLQRNVKIFEAAGLHFHDLIGQTLRVRGLLETRFGPEIEVSHPNDLEIITNDVSEIETSAEAARRP